MDLVRHDLAKDPPSRALLERLIDGSQLEKFLNPRSPACKALGLEKRKLTKGEAIELMLQEPNLIRRPIVIVDGRAVFGFDPEAYDQIGR